MDKLNLVLLAGGPSSEHEVSLNSAANILKSLNPEKYNVCQVKIEKDGSWQIPLSELAREVDFAFIALHGTYGEDGALQSELDAAGLKYQGSGTEASALAMDKVRSGRLFEQNGLKVPRFVSSLDKFENFLTEVGTAVLKPSDGGSSAGTFVVRSLEDLQARLPEALAVSSNLMLQEFIAGDEVTCGVLEIDGQPRALPPTQIIAQAGQFYDYKSKYATGGSRHIVPAPYPHELLQKIQDTALKAHATLGCRGLSRTDMLLSNGEIYVLETNTLPGFTSTSLFPEAAEVDGISYGELLDMLIENGLKR